MSLLLSLLAMLVTIFLGVGFSGLGDRLAVYRSRGQVADTTRVELPPPTAWKSMSLDPSGLLPWPSHVADRTTHFKPLPWPSATWPEPFVKPADVARVTTGSAEVAHKAPSKPAPKAKAKGRTRPPDRPVPPPRTAADDFFGGADGSFVESVAQPAAPQATSGGGEGPNVTPDMVRSWVGMYGLAGAVERYRQTRNVDFSVAAKDIAEILRN